MKINDAKKLITATFSYNLSQWKGKSTDINKFVCPTLLGDPGVGKTTLIRQVAKELDVPISVSIFAQMDAGELGGFGIPKMAPLVDGSGNTVLDEDGKPYMVDVVVRARPDHLPTFDYGFFVLDEIPQAVLMNQNVASQLVNEYHIGKHGISHGITICCTGNKPENKAGTTPMPSHLVDRLCLITIDVDYGDWLLYAQSRQFDPMIRAYLEQNQADLHRFEPGAKACPTPRSWEKANAFLSMNLPEHILSETLAGTIGAGVAPKFIGWCKVRDKLPKLQDILAHPNDAPVFGNREADINYLLLANLADIADEQNIEPMLQYIRRMPNQEFAIYWARDMLNQHPEIGENKHFTKWNMTQGVKLLSGDEV